MLDRLRGWLKLGLTLTTASLIVINPVQAQGAYRNLRHLCAFQASYPKMRKYSADAATSRLETVCAALLADRNREHPPQSMPAIEITVDDMAFRSEIASVFARGNPGSMDQPGTPDRYVTLWTNTSLSFSIELLPANYRVWVYAHHDQPGPVVLDAWANEWPLGRVIFARADGSWEWKCLHLSTALVEPTEAGGEVTLVIRFVNDGGPGGARDASIGHVRIEPLTE